MKQSIILLLAVMVAGFSVGLRAGPIEEVLQIAGPRLQALEQGMVDAYVAAYADNAVFQSSLTAFRIEGKDAIRTYFTELFQLYPKRRGLPTQPTVRAYNDDVVIQNGYSVLYLTNQNGQVSTYH